MKNILLLPKKNLRRFILLVLLFVTCIIVFKRDYSSILRRRVYSEPNSNLGSHRYIIDNYYEKRVRWKTSNLGSVLFKNVDTQLFHHAFRENKTFVVLIWKYYDWLKVRHIQSFNKKSKQNDSLEGCSVRNCKFVGSDTYLDTADAVVVHIQKGLYPKVNKRNPNQRWIILSDESPKNTFSMAGGKAPRLKELANIFNWTMTYRSDADVPVPYGRTIPLSKPWQRDPYFEAYNMKKIVPNWEEKHYDVVAAILISNCNVPHRTKFLKKISEYIKIDVYGGCSPDKKNYCPGHFKSDCKILNTYLFYLVLENSLCRQYLTEKAFYHAYSKGAIPVIMGPPLDDCQKLLPPNSFLHVDSYKSVKELADHMIEISSNLTALMSYHEWRYNFETVNEHGYFGDRSYHFCRVCEALNYNDGEVSVYDEDDLRLFFDPNILCGL